MSRLGAIVLGLAVGAGCGGQSGSSPPVPASAPPPTSASATSAAGASAVEEFESVLDLPEQEGATVLLGARPVQHRDYPALFYGKLETQHCTAMLVGAQALLTAAHCVSDGGAIRLKLTGRTHQGSCRRHPAYPMNTTADWALCRIEPPIAVPAYESIGDPSVPLREGSLIQLTGFGCTRVDSESPKDGRLRAGEATIRGGADEGAEAYHLRVEGDVVLCFGDSGGPAMTVSETGRRIAGVNSRSDLKRTSFVSSTGVGAFQEFARTWASTAGVQICGIHDNAEGCR